MCILLAIATYKLYIFIPEITDKRADILNPFSVSAVFIVATTILYFLHGIHHIYLPFTAVY